MGSSGECHGRLVVQRVVSWVVCCINIPWKIHVPQFLYVSMSLCLCGPLSPLYFPGLFVSLGFPPFYGRLPVGGVGSKE